MRCGAILGWVDGTCSGFDAFPSTSWKKVIEGPCTMKDWLS